MPRSFRYVLLAIALILLVITLNIYEFELVSTAIVLSIVPITTVYYLLFHRNKNKRLTVFFILFTLADIINILDFNDVINWSYFVCNTLYILAYCTLIFYIIETLNFKLVFKKFLLDFIVLLVLDLYLVYVLISFVNPLDFEDDYSGFIQVVEFIYNFTIIIILSLAFLNFVQNPVRKYFYLLCSCALIVFSELILIGYYYILEDVRISYASTVLFISGIIMLLFHTFVPVKFRANFTDESMVSNE